MQIEVLFFGATASIVGKRSIDLILPDGSNAKSIFEKIKLDFPALSDHKLLYSLNQEYAKGDEIVRDCDEVAVFTAVSGG